MKLEISFSLLLGEAKYSMCKKQCRELEEGESGK
jgi:hypothetical protein